MEERIKDQTFSDSFKDKGTGLFNCVIYNMSPLLIITNILLVQTNAFSLILTLRTVLAIVLDTGLQ